MAREQALLARTREDEAARELQELELERRLTTEATRIREASARIGAERLVAERERQRLTEQENQLKIETLTKKVVDLSQTLAQGSQQTQGEAQEVVLRDVLGHAFPLDTLDDVAKGVRGADLVQVVRTPDGRDCGTLLWESKRTRAWSDEWLAKVRDDQREAGAAVAIVVSQVLPTRVRNFGLVDGVWVCGWAFASSLATVLRIGLADVARLRVAAEGRGDKMEMLYSYLTGVEFKTRITGVVEAFHDMQSDLDTERTAMQSRWKKREKQIKRAVTNVAAFYGDLQAIAGARLADHPLLALETHDEPADSPDEDDEAEVIEDGRARPRLSAPRSEDGVLVRVLVELLPANGSTVGNGSLCERFISAALTHGVQVTRDDYDRCRDVLVSRGSARRGRGRGGSLSLVLDVAGLEPSTFVG